MAVVTFSHRHLAVLAFAAAASCGGQHPAPFAAPSSPAETVEQFLAAVNANDLSKMGTLWGDEHGPNRNGSETVRTQRLTIIQRLLRGDSHEMAGSDLTNPARPKLNVAITQGTRRFTVPFTLVQVRGGGGWLINQIDLDPAMPAAGSSPR